MPNNNSVGSRVLLRVLFAALFAVSGLASCSGGGGSTSTNTTPAPTPGGIVLSLVPARTSGVAPLVVFFDASATTDTGVTTRPFHDLEYTWSFGDPSSGTWASGAQPGVSSKNSATGPVAAHVFETPGTYTVTLTAFDGTNTATTNTTITVQDPNTVFAGSNTICFSTSGTFTGCPAGATQTTTSNFVTAIANQTTNKRLLFRRGETFTAASTAAITVTGPGIVGAFGTGAAPVVQMTGSSGILGLSSQDTPNISDWRIMDMDFDGLNQTSGFGIIAGGGINQVLILNMHIHDIYNGVNFNYSLLDWHNNHGHPGHSIFDQIAIVNSTITPNTGDGINSTTTSWRIYASAQHFAVLGNTLGNVANTTAMGSHTIRTGYIGKGVISNNIIARPGAVTTTGNAGTLAIKMHAPPWCDASSAVGECLTLDTTPALPSYSYLTTTHPIGVFAATSGYTEQVVVSDNKIIGGSGPYLVNIGPQHALHDERVRDVIVERNKFQGGGLATRSAVVINGSETTVRNNICDLTGGSGSGYCVNVRLNGDGSPAPPPENIRIYNNTAYSGDASSAFAGVLIEAGASNITVQNNLAYAPLASSSVMISNTCGGACLATASNNSTDTQVKNTSPLFIATPPVHITDWIPTAGSYAINGGTGVPVWSDFFRTSRPQNGVMDIGAVEGP